MLTFSFVFSQRLMEFDIRVNVFDKSYSMIQMFVAATQPILKLTDVISRWHWRCKHLSLSSEGRASDLVMLFDASRRSIATGFVVVHGHGMIVDVDGC